MKEEDKDEEDRNVALAYFPCHDGSLPLSLLALVHSPWHSKQLLSV